MTSNQLKRQQNFEEQRSNLAKETEANRSNKERERETNRSNRANERETQRHNRITERNDTLTANVRAITEPLKATSSLAKSIPFINDWAWYFENAQRMKDNASYPWGRAVGSTVGVGSSNSLITKNILPGLTALYIHHHIGFAEAGGDKKSAIFRAAQALFDAVNKNTGRTSDYEPVDLLMMTIGVADARAFCEFLKRSYRMINYTSPYNEYLPRLILTACGFDYDDLVTNIYKFKGIINWFEDQLYRYPLIPNLPIMKRWEMDYKYLLRDEPSDLSQYYVIAPASVAILDTSGTATQVVYRRWVNHAVMPDTPSTFRCDLKYHTVEDIRNFMEVILNGLEGWQDVKIMRADLLKAFEDSALYTKDYVGEGQLPIISEDPLVLEQIRNAYLVGENLHPTTFSKVDEDYFTDLTIYQQSGFPVSNPHYYGNEFANFGDGGPSIVQGLQPPVYTHFPSPNEVVFTEATRFRFETGAVDENSMAAAIISPVSNLAWGAIVWGYCPELLGTPTMFHRGFLTNVSLEYRSVRMHNVVSTINDWRPWINVSDISRIVAFKNFPIQFAISFNDVGGELVPAFDVYKYAPYEPGAITAMNESILPFMFGLASAK